MLPFPKWLVGADTWLNIQQRGNPFHSEEFYAEAEAGKWTYSRSWSWQGEPTSLAAFAANYALTFAGTAELLARWLARWSAAATWQPTYDSQAFYDTLRRHVQRLNSIGVYPSVMLTNVYSEPEPGMFTTPTSQQRARLSSWIASHVKALKGLSFGIEIMNEGPRATFALQKSLVDEIHAKFPGIPVFTNSGFGGRDRPSLQEILDLGGDVTSVPLVRGEALPTAPPGRTLLYNTDHTQEGLNAPDAGAGYAYAKRFLDQRLNFEALCARFGQLDNWTDPTPPWNQTGKNSQSYGYTRAIRERFGKEEPPMPPPDKPKPPKPDDPKPPKPDPPEDKPKPPKPPKDKPKPGDGELAQFFYGVVTRSRYIHNNRRRHKKGDPERIEPSEDKELVSRVRQLIDRVREEG